MWILIFAGHWGTWIPLYKKFAIPRNVWTVTVKDPSGMSFRLSRTMSVIVYCMHRNEKRKRQSRSTSSILHNDSQIRLNWPGWTTSWGAGRYPSWRDNQMVLISHGCSISAQMSRRVVPKRYPVGEKSVCFFTTTSITTAPSLMMVVERPLAWEYLRTCLLISVFHKKKVKVHMQFTSIPSPANDQTSAFGVIG